MDKTIKKFSIPRCLDKTPEIFGFSVQTAVTSLGLILLALIMLAKSVWVSLLVITITYANIKLAKKFKRVGGVFPYLLLFFEKKESIRANTDIESLICNKVEEDGR